MSDRKDRQSGTGRGRREPPKKSGAGGKGVWGTPKDDATTSHQDSSSSRNDKPVAQYVKLHKLEDNLEKAVNALCSEMPENPFEFLANYLQDIASNYQQPKPSKANKTPDTSDETSFPSLGGGTPKVEEKEEPVTPAENNDDEDEDDEDEDQGDVDALADFID